MEFTEGSDLWEIMEAVGEIVLDVQLHYRYLRPKERGEKRLYIDHLIRSYVDKFRYSNNPLPDHVFFRQAIDSYVTAFRDGNPFVSRIIRGIMGDLIFERLDKYEAELKSDYAVETLEEVLV